MITYKPVANYLGAVGKPNTGLGNQMFQVASTIGIAINNGYDWVLPTWHNPFTGDFNIQDIDLPLHKMEWGYQGFNISDNVSLYGYMQAYKHFDHCGDLIRSLFTFRNQSKGLGGEFIAVHIRRGDYVGKDGYHPLLGADYYNAALDRFPPLPVYVFTDDVGMASEIYPYPDSFFCDSVNPDKDMELMSHASHFIIGNSSFSWWPAWLSRSENVIAPKDWFGYKYVNLDTSCLFPDHWMLI